MKTCLEFAKRALQEVREDNYLGSSNISTVTRDNATDKPVISLGLLTSYDSAREKRRRVDALLDKNMKDIANRQSEKYQVAWFLRMPPKWGKETSYEMFKSLEASRTGNCHKLSMDTLIKLIDIGYQGSAEIFQFNYLDHVFLVLNRPKNSDPKKWTTWGSDCVIVDPWLNEVFTADYFGEFWRKQARILFANRDSTPPDKTRLKYPPPSIFETDVISNDEDFRNLRETDTQKTPRTLL